MSTLLKLENLAFFLLNVYFFSLMELPWLWFIGGLLLPDLGMLGYLVNNKVGAFTYNITHHLAIAVGFLVIGLMSQNQLLEFVGIIMLAHSSMDRVLGFGLKYPDSFKHTHLGML